MKKIQPPIATFFKLAVGGTVQKANNASSLKLYIKDYKRVFIHPKSANFTCGDYPSVWLVYHQIVETSKCFITDSTMIFPYPLLLFGGKIEVDHKNKQIKVCIIFILI